MEYIDYVTNDGSGNSEEVMKFVGDVPECKLCGGFGEYETEYGPRGCDECNSSCIPFIDFRGRRILADWGDRIERWDAGLHLILGGAE